MTPREVVWLGHAGATVAHEPDGWNAAGERATVCGQIVDTGRAPVGILIQWRLLDHDAVARCRSCWSAS